MLSQHLHQVVGELVVHNALAADGALLCAITGGGIVLVIHQNDGGVVGGENLLGLAFVQLFTLFHDTHTPLHSRSMGGTNVPARASGVWPASKAGSILKAGGANAPACGFDTK